MINNFRKQNTKQKGSLLFEMLIVISLAAIIISVGTNAVFLGMRSSKASGERDIANSLASGALESTKAIIEENWQNIYGLTKSTQHYYPSESGGKWVLVEGDETININNESYTRYLTIDNVSRESTTRNIESSYVSDNDDPSTQKVTVTVGWSDSSPVTVSEYFFRWRNKICNQTEWTTAEPGNAVKECPSITYDAKENIDVAGGSLKLLSSSAPTVAIGDTYQGGIVFYILQVGDSGYDAGVQKGFISPTTDQSAGIVFSVLNTINAGTASGVGTGNANTIAIVSAYGTENNAAKLCSDLSLGSKTDWYLPSKDELNKLYENRAYVGGFANTEYWTSTERSDYPEPYAYRQNMSSGNQSQNGDKQNNAYVRCVRSF